MTFKVELLLIVGLIVASLVLAPMLEGTSSRRSSVSVMLRGIPTIIIILTVLHRPAADP